MRHSDAITAKRVPSPVETKADPFTLESLIAWLETQPPKIGYNFNKVHGCLACLYLQASGFPEPWERTDTTNRRYRDVFGGSIEIYHAIANVHPWTFGAALERARIALSKR